jgi:hypothetical protein
MNKQRWNCLVQYSLGIPCLEHNSIVIHELNFLYS